MKRKLYAVFVAGVTGSRMGGDTPKQFLPLRGEPVLQRTIRIFLEAVPGIKVVTVLPKVHMKTWEDLCNFNSFDVPQILVEGGLTRFHSVKNALARIPDGATVAIHDGVRPLVSADMVKKMFSAMETCRALIPVLPVTDTLKTLEKNPDGSLATAPVPELDRSVIYAAQTPQIFRSEDLKAAYTQAFDMSFTDDASVARRYGIPLSYFPGEKLNIKLTTPDDMDLASALLLLGRTSG